MKKKKRIFNPTCSFTICLFAVANMAYVLSLSHTLSLFAAEKYGDKIQQHKTSRT